MREKDMCNAGTWHTLQRTKIENSKQIFSEKELLGHSPKFYTHVSVSDLYIPTIDRPSLLQEKCGPVTDTWMWKLGLRPRNSQKKGGIHKWIFVTVYRIFCFLQATQCLMLGPWMITSISSTTCPPRFIFWPVLKGMYHVIPRLHCLVVTVFVRNGSFLSYCLEQIVFKNRTL